MRLFFVLVMLFSLPVYSGGIKGPFEPALPEPEEEEVEAERPHRRPDVRTLPSFALQGILWSDEKSHVVINGEVYSEGDSIGGLDAEIIEIKKDTVLIYFAGRVYRRSVQKWGER